MLTAEINPGTPFLDHGVIEFQDVVHPALDTLSQKLADSAQALWKTIKATPGHEPTLKDFNHIFEHQSGGAFYEYLGHDKFIRTHAKAESEQFVKVFDKYAEASLELRQAQLEVVNGLKNLIDLDGAPVSQADLAKAIENFKKDWPIESQSANHVQNSSLLDEHFNKVREGGYLSALKENFGLDGIKRHPAASIFKAATVALGGTLVFDAISHSKRGTGEDAKNRSWSALLGEGAIGAGLVVGAALHGRN